MRRRLRPFFGACLALSAAGLILAQSPQPPGKRPPREYSRSVANAFFRNVLEETGPGQPGVVAVRPVTPGGNPASPQGGEEGGGKWESIVSAATLENAVKDAALSVGELVGTKGKFNTGHRDIEIIYSTLAIVFSAIDDYAGDVRFKEKAAGMRDVLARSAANCKVNSDGAWNEARQRHEDLQQLVRGASVDVPEAAPEVPAAELARRTALMKRMRQSLRDRLQPWTSSAGELSSNKDQVIHEAEILAMLSKTIQDPSYEYAEDEGYLAHAAEVQKQSQELLESLKLDSLEKVQGAVGAIGQACDACHADWR